MKYLIETEILQNLVAQYVIAKGLAKYFKMLARLD